MTGNPHTFPHEAHEGYFVSGSNHAGEIRGLALSGYDVGIAVDAIDKSGDALRELELYAGGPMRVFVDSGAFGEVAFNRPHVCGRGAKCKAGTCAGNGTLPFPDAPAWSWVDVKPISDADWDQRLAVYERLAASLRTQLYVVAPDKVGDQVETLNRLRRYADRIAAMQRDHRVNVIVPMQRGPMPMIAFDVAVRKLLPGVDFIRGIPSQKGAMPAAQLAEYCDDLLWDRDVDELAIRFHLLGVGPYSPDFDKVRGSIPRWAADVTCDSVRITALVGLRNGPNGGPRDLTRRRLELLAARPDLEGNAAEVKFRTVQGHFIAEGRRLLAESMAAGWFDPELVEDDAALEDDFDGKAVAA